VPVTVAVVPTGPCVTDKAMVGVGIVNVVEAVSLPPSLPVATTVYPAGASEGTVNVQLKVPVALVVWEVQVCVAGVAPLKVKVVIVVDTE